MRLLVATLLIAGCAVEYLVVGDGMPAPLTKDAVLAESGRDVFVDREQGHCVLCHALENLDVPFQGNVGPDLSDVGLRLTPAQIRLRIVDASVVNPRTVMPPYYRTTDLHQVAESHVGETVLSARQIEALVVFLSLQRKKA